MSNSFGNLDLELIVWFHVEPEVANCVALSEDGDDRSGSILRETEIWNNGGRVFNSYKIVFNSYLPRGVHTRGSALISIFMKPSIHPFRLSVLQARKDTEMEIKTTIVNQPSDDPMVVPR